MFQHFCFKLYLVIHELCSNNENVLSISLPQTYFLMYGQLLIHLPETQHFKIYTLTQEKISTGEIKISTVIKKKISFIVPITIIHFKTSI